jgi:hypothetical protein
MGKVQHLPINLTVNSEDEERGGAFTNLSHRKNSKNGITNDRRKLWHGKSAIPIYLPVNTEDESGCVHNLNLTSVLLSKTHTPKKA